LLVINIVADHPVLENGSVFKLDDAWLPFLAQVHSALLAKAEVILLKTGTS